MAETLLSGVLVKLTDFTVERVLQLCGIEQAISRLRSQPNLSTEVMMLNAEVEQLNDELNSINTFIQDADNMCIVAVTQKKWVLDLIEIAYQIEDVVDVFLSECSVAHSHRSSLKNILSSCQKMIEDIRTKISRIKESRETYNIERLGGDIRQNAQSGSRPKLDPSWDPEVVGFDKDIMNVVENLCDEKNKCLAVVSIVGPGGIGKTTLAQKVCHSERVRNEFGKPAWVTISQNYQHKDFQFHSVLVKIAKSFNVLDREKFNGLDTNELASKIQNHLKERKYLIVLDDVWTRTLYDELKCVLLPKTNNGSRVLITTRLVRDVAKCADTSYVPHQINLLNDDESLKLFLRKAIPKNHQNSVGSNPDLGELPKEFIKKCDGLPLALITLGRLASTRPYAYRNWKLLLDTMSWWDTTGSGVDLETRIQFSDRIAASFVHLPFAMKFCFMYFAALPEDQLVEAQTLLRMWIAEGLIPFGGGGTMEDRAKEFLLDLVQRSMVQVSEKYPDGSIKYLHVHCILRDLAVQKAKEYKFLMVCSKQDDWKSPHIKASRRLAVHYSNFNEHMKQHASQHLRSLLIFQKSNVDYSSQHLRSLHIFQKSNVDYSKYKLLRVLANTEKGLKLQSFKRFKRLPLLKYLQLHSSEEWIGEESPSRKSKLPDFGKWVKYLQPHSYPSRKNTERDFGKLIKAMEYLSMSGDIQLQTFGEIFPCFENLRHMIIKSTNKESPMVLEDNMLPPNLVELHLQGFELSRDPMPVLEKLGSLKILTIESTNRSYLLEISCSTKGFQQLEKLTLDNIQMLQEWKIEPGAMPLLKWLNVPRCDKLQLPPELIHRRGLRVAR